MVEYKDLQWKDDKLYFGKVDTTVRLLKDERCDFMYWLTWDFGELQKSVNFYNLTNAKDNGKVLYMRYRNSDAEKPTVEARGLIIMEKMTQSTTRPLKRISEAVCA